MKLRAAIEDWSTLNLSFVVQLGDLVDGRDVESEFNAVLGVTRRLKTRWVHVIGNHDLQMRRSKLHERLKLESPYYGFTIQNWRFLVLDSLDISRVGWPAGSDQYRAGERYLKSGRNLNSIGGAIGPEQNAWLRNELQIAMSAGLNVILFAHIPVHPDSARNDLLLWNRDEVLSVIADTSCVVAYIAGHYHAGGYAQEGGVHYLTLKALVNAPKDSNAYGVIDVYSDRLELRGRGEIESQTFERTGGCG